jgi:hypothetical protein
LSKTQLRLILLHSAIASFVLSAVLARFGYFIFGGRRCPHKIESEKKTS